MGKEKTKNDLYIAGILVTLTIYIHILLKIKTATFGYSLLYAHNVVLKYLYNVHNDVRRRRLNVRATVRIGYIQYWLFNPLTTKDWKLDPFMVLDPKEGT